MQWGAAQQPRQQNIGGHRCADHQLFSRKGIFPYGLLGQSLFVRSLIAIQAFQSTGTLKAGNGSLLAALKSSGNDCLFLQVLVEELGDLAIASQH